MNQTLTVAPVGGVPDQQQDEIGEAWQDVYDRACQQLSIAGFDQRVTAQACPFPDITPWHYTNLEGDQYIEVMAQVDYWFGRAKEWLGWIEAELIAREGEFKDVIRELKTSLREQGKAIAIKAADIPKETELKEAAERQPYPRQLAMRIAELRAQKQVLDSRIEALERFAAGLSRRVTIRGQEVDIHGRQNRPGPRRFGE